MDAKYTIKKYIQPSKALAVVTVLLLVVTVVCLAAWFMTISSADAVAMEKMDEFYPNESEVGSMAYVDVVGISNWLYDYDGAVYYSVEDAEGYFYTVRVSEDEYKKMKAQQEYWLRESDSEPMPEAHRLTGVVSTTVPTVKSSLAESWDISVSEYEQYFGKLYLNTTTTAGEEKAMGWFVGMIFCGIFAGILLACLIGASSRTRKSLNTLEERGLLERAAMELEAPGNLTIGKDQARLSQQFLFERGGGIAIPFGDILWCYQQTRQQGFSTVGVNLIVRTASGKMLQAISVPGKDKKGLVREAMVWIAQHNPNVFLGYTNENMAAYSQMCKNGIR